MLPKQLKDRQRHQRQPKQVELFLQSAYMHEHTKVEDYKFITFCDTVCAEWERQCGKKILQHADKLSTVKRKGKSPQYKDQKQKSDKQKANDQGDDNHNRKHPHKCNNRKGKGKTADTDHQHSHLASSSIVLVVEFPPLNPTPGEIYLQPSDVPVTTKAKTVVATHRPDRIFYQSLNHVLAQSFTGKPATIHKIRSATSCISHTRIVYKTIISRITPCWRVKS